MPAIINHKICDQANACGGISVCPVGAFTYNEKTKRIEIDNNKCISCGACEKTCPIGAIGVAKTAEEYDELKRAIDEDPRSADDLFVDRFGGDIINAKVMISYKALDKTIKGCKQNTLIELFNDDVIACLLKSIPYKDITDNTAYKQYYRCNVADNDFAKYGAKELPALLLVNEGKVVKTISGYVEEKDKQRLFKKLK